MAPPNIKITSLPTRYEPLISTFGEKAQLTFVPPDEDLETFKRFLASAESAAQGKIIFLTAPSGTGKSTFVHSLEVFLADKIGAVHRLPLPHELSVSAIPGYLANLPATKKFTIVNFDGREAPFFNEPEYQTFLGSLNALLRHRRDLLIIWPVTDASFADKLIALLTKVGGRSAFGISPQHELRGISQTRFHLVLEKLLQVANWRLEDAAISTTEVEGLIAQADRIGTFLDSLQELIANRFDIDQLGMEFPTVVMAISSGAPGVREVVRALRRADSYYIEASRLLMYTRRSNVAEWWANRAESMRSALPHVIALFNAQLVSVSPSAVIHSVLQFGDDELKADVTGVRADRGNARRVMESCELFKYFEGGAIDNRQYGSNVNNDTFESYDRIQKKSETKHRTINQSILSLAEATGAQLPNLQLENSLVTGLQTDATYQPVGTSHVALEFHHKATSETNQNKVAIYILEKLKEYAINFGLAAR